MRHRFKRGDMQKKFITIITFVIFSFGANICGSSHNVNIAAASFTDRTLEYGLKGLSNSPAAWADFDNDGWVDLYVDGILWLNQEGKSFSPIPVGRGGGVLADFDNDGFVDIFSYSELKLYRNKEGRGFEEFKLELPDSIAGDFVSVGAAWADFNNNGYVDIYVGGYEKWQKNRTYTDFILMNNEGKSFSAVENNTGYRARGITICDFNQNGNMDVYVSNYRLQPNLLLVNDGQGNFVDMADTHNAVATTAPFKGGHSIAAVWADFDNSSHFDLFAGNFAHDDHRGSQPQSRFLRNTGAKNNYRFEDLGQCGIHYQESYASPAAGDYNNDGYIDLFFTTVYDRASFGVANNPVLFSNDGNWNFTDVSKQEGLSQLGHTYQAAWADINNNGNLDLVSAGRLFVNQGNSNHCLQVRLIGDGKAVNSPAIGAQVRIELEGKTLTRQVEAGTGQGNQNDLVLHFGLGRHSEAVDLKIRWPNGHKQTADGIEPDTMSAISYEPDKINSQSRD